MRRLLSLVPTAGALLLLSTTMAHAAPGPATGHLQTKDCSYFTIDTHAATSKALHVCQYQLVLFHGFHEGDVAVSDTPSVFRITLSGSSMRGIADGVGTAHVTVTHKRHVIAKYTITVDPQP